MTKWKTDNILEKIISENCLKEFVRLEQAKEEFINKLERTISAYFDYIERLIENKTSFTMWELSSSVKKFLEFNEYKILEWTWKISHSQAEEKAFLEYDEYNKKQVIDYDFDKFVRELEERK